MTARVDTSSPEDFTVVEAADAFSATFVTDEAPSNREVEATVGGTPVLLWSAGVQTVSSGYAADVLFGYRTVTVRVTRVGGWTSGAVVAWAVIYRDAATADVTTSGSFVRATFTPAQAFPPDGARAVTRSPTVYRSYAVSAGTPGGVDLTIGGEAAVSGGAICRPAFSGTTTSAGSTTNAAVERRRAFRWGERVAVVARPRVMVGGVAYRGRDDTSFTVAVKPGPGLPAANGERGRAPLPPVAQAVLEMASSIFRPRPESPDPINTAIFFVVRSVLGGLMRGGLRPKLLVPPAPEDIPSDRAILQFLVDVTPLRQTLVDVIVQPEDRAAVDEAWRSGHPIEQLVSVLYPVLLLGSD